MASSTQQGYSFFIFVLDNLVNNRIRTVLTIISVAIALGSAITLVGLIESVEATIADGYDARNVKLVVLQPNRADPMTSRLNINLLPMLKNITGVKGVQAILLDFLSLNNKQNILVYGWPENYPEIQKKTNEGSTPLKKGEVLIGNSAAALGGYHIGDKIDINLEIFTIAGLFDSESVFESGVIYMRLKDLQHLVGVKDMVTFYFIELPDSVSDEEVTLVKNRIMDNLPNTRVVTTGIFVQSNNTNIILSGLSKITLITSTLLAFLIVSTIMVLSVTEREQDLGILRAMGWSVSRVALLILTEASTMVVIGSLLGVLIGWIGVEIALLQIQSMGIYATSIVTPSLFAQTALATAAIGVLGASIPVYRVLNIKVMQALKKE